jgi:hypothetical protein
MDFILILFDGIIDFPITSTKATYHQGCTVAITNTKFCEKVTTKRRKATNLGQAFVRLVTVAKNTKKEKILFLISFIVRTIKHEAETPATIKMAPLMITRMGYVLGSLNQACLNAPDDVAALFLVKNVVETFDEKVRRVLILSWLTQFRLRPDISHNKSGIDRQKDWKEIMT